MIIKNIEIQNWGRYPSVEVPVDVNEERNLVLIRARNNNGKTTLFYALKWALYGEDGLKNHKKQILPIQWINRQAAAQGDGVMFVEMTLEIGGRDYRLQRTQKFFQTNTGDDIIPDGDEVIEIFDQQNGETVSDAGKNNKTKQNWINTKIIPPKISQFFFFDGEDIKKYTDKPEQEIKEAIVQILGIKALTNAMTDVRDAEKIFSEDHRRKVNKSSKDAKTKKESEDKDVAIKDKKAELGRAIKKKEDDIIRKDGLTDRLRKNAVSEEKINERTRIEETNESLEKTRDQNNQKLKELRGNSSIMLLNGLMEIIDKTEETPPSKDQWDSKTAAYMIKKKFVNCVCDTHIDEKILAKLKDKIIDLKPNPQAQLKRFVESSFGRTQPNVIFSELNHVISERVRIQNEIDVNMTAINRINDELPGKGSSSMATEIERLRDKEQKTEAEIRQDVSDINSLNSELEALKNEQAALVKKLEKETPKAEISLAQKLKEFTDNIYNSFNIAVDFFYTQRKPKLEQHISEVFLKLINNPKLYNGLEISNQWEIFVKYYDNTLLPTHQYGPSAGAAQIVATAFIAGLNKFASKSGPVVIDTPLGRLDDIHREKILKYYNKMSKQVIILYTPTEITKEDLMLVEDSVKHHYEIIPIDQKPDLSRLVQYESVN